MLYQEFVPHAGLLPYISCIWTLENQLDSTTFKPLTERILPDGQMEMIFHLAEPFAQVVGDQQIKQARSFIYGQLHSFLDLAPTAQAKILAFRFFPAGLSAFLPFSPKEFQQTYLSLEEIYGIAGKQLEEQVNNSCQIRSAIETVEGFLLKRLAQARLKDPFITHISKVIIQSKGQGDIQDLIRSHKISSRHFQRKFLEITGTRSKTLAKITRLQHALQLVQQHPDWKLTDISLATGYFDQAHFIRDFKRFTGVSPGKFFQQTHQLNDQFVHS